MKSVPGVAFWFGVKNRLFLQLKSINTAPSFEKNKHRNHDTASYHNCGAYLNTADNIDTTAHAVQKAVRIVTLNCFRWITVDYYTIFNSPKLIGQYTPNTDS